MTRFASFALLLTAFSAFLIGCGQTPVKPCESDRDCEECQTCMDGNCIPIANCQTGCGDGCTTPPAAECIDSQTLRSYLGQGRCEQDVCVYDHEDVTCGQACQNGVCEGEPCLGKLCDQPPGACYAAQGVCRPDNGVCDYDLLDDGSSCDDRNGCTEDDTCKSGSCHGDSVICDTPPEPTCLNGSTLQVWSSNGSCLNGTCGYPDQEVNCASGCEDGGCEGDPCAGVICDDPPSACFEASGTCSSGVCSYPLANGGACNDADVCTTNDRCFNGVCTGDPLVCNNPPDNTCEDADTMRSYSSSGFCQAGQCEYPYQDVNCSQGCSAGLCSNDPCGDVVCDDSPNDCYMANGSCSGGSCYYPPLNGAACDDSDGCTFNDVCSNGVCHGQPSSCDEPPDNHCLDGDVLRAYAGLGGCLSGVCEYTYQDVTCAFGCDGGYCVGDPCHGVVCESPPNDCHFQYGTCVDGSCDYEPLNGVACDDTDSCTQSDSCQAGTCQGTPVLCDQPPADTCVDGTVLRAFAPVGTCSQGDCEYPHQDVPCADGCLNGACGGGDCELLVEVASAVVSSGATIGRTVAIAGEGPFALVWEDNIEGAMIQFRSVAADGTFAGQEQNLGWADGGPFGIASSGSTFAIAPYLYGQPSELWRFDASGNHLGTTTLGADSGLFYRPPAVAWAGSQWAVAIDTEIALVDPSGGLISGGARVGYDMGANLVWNGTAFGLAWVDYGELGGETSFQLYSAAGVPQGTRLVVGGALCGDGCSSQTFLAWAGSEFILAYAGEDGVHLARVSADGTTVLSDQVIDANSNWYAPDSMAYNPARGEVAVVYARPNPDESPANEVVMTRCAPNGVDCSTTRLVQSDAGWPGSGWVQAVGQEYVVAYTEADPSGQGYTVHFARYGCGAP